MHFILFIDRTVELGAQVVRTEDIQIGIKRLGSSLIGGQLQTHGSHFGGTKMIIALGPTQTIA